MNPDSLPSFDEWRKEAERLLREVRMAVTKQCLAPSEKALAACDAADFALLAHLAAHPSAAPLSTAEDANNYCRILTLLGMEEEGDPVAEVERLISSAAPQAVLLLPEQPQSDKANLVVAVGKDLPPAPPGDDERAFLQWANETLIELNPSNYNHDDACACSAAAVEVSLAIQQRLARPAELGASLHPVMREALAPFLAGPVVGPSSGARSDLPSMPSISAPQGAQPVQEPVLTVHIFLADGRREISVTPHVPAMALPIGDHAMYLGIAAASPADAAPVVPQEVRMLTDDEIWDCECGGFIATGKAIQRKFMEVNAGLTIPATKERT